MDAFEYAVNQTLSFEGIYSNNPDDRGGETKYGITKREFERALEKCIISGVSDIKDLTVVQAKAIYKINYWFSIRLNEVDSYLIASEMFDTAVNMGTGTAVKIAQDALNFLGENLEVDGKIGPNTIEAINKWCKKDERALFVALNGEQYIRYKNNSQMMFHRGWTKRIQSYKEV